MFSLFRRKRDAAQEETDGPEADDARLFHHSRIPDAADLSAHLAIGDEGPAIGVELLDMNIQGAGLRMPFHLAPAPQDDRYVEFTVSHVQDGWRVTSLARVTRATKLDDQHVHVGLQFVNLGDLYAQLDDALGRYFNRRSTLRVSPEDGHGVPVRIGYHHHRLRGVAHDLSRTGVGVRMTLVQAAVFKTGERVDLRIDLPNSRTPLEVGAHVRHGYRLGEEVVLGMEFDDERTPMKPDQRKVFLGYLAEREQRTLALQRKLARGA